MSRRRELEESWARTARHLSRAADEIRPRLSLDAFDEYLGQNELELAADVLCELGDEGGDMTADFWTAMASAYETMLLDEKATRCRARATERPG